MNYKQDKTILRVSRVFRGSRKMNRVLQINSSSNTYKYSQRIGCIMIYPLGNLMCFVVLNKSNFS
jgi:hypothetical protein